jgi:hypothetical protein
VKVKRLTILAAPAILVAGIILFGLGDVVVSDNEITSSIGNPSGKYYYYDVYCG